MKPNPLTTLNDSFDFTLLSYDMSGVSFIDLFQLKLNEDSNRIETVEKFTSSNVVFGIQLCSIVWPGLNHKHISFQGNSFQISDFMQYRNCLSAAV